MKIYRRKTKRGLRWILDSGERGGQKRVLQEFRTRAEADGVLQRNQIEQEQLGDAWLGLSYTERLDATKAVIVARQRGISVLEAVNAYTKEVPPSISLHDAAADFFKAKEASGKRGAYMAHLRTILGTFMKGRESEAINLVTPAMVREFLSPTRYKPATLQGMRRRLATWFAWCVRHKLCATDPMGQVDEITVPHPAPKILTVEECEKLLRAAEETDRGMIPWLALGLFCGIRPEEIRRLTWEDVKIDRGFVEISGEASKVRARRLVRLFPVAVEWLKLGGDLPPGNFWKRIRKLRSAAGIAEWPCDVLRHTSASMMLCHYKDAQRTALELGNSPDVLFRHYRELVTTEDAERFFNITPSPVSLAAAS